MTCLILSYLTRTWGVVQLHYLTVTYDRATVCRGQFRFESNQSIWVLVSLVCSSFWGFIRGLIATQSSLRMAHHLQPGLTPHDRIIAKPQGLTRKNSVKHQRPACWSVSSLSIFVLARQLNQITYIGAFYSDVLWREESIFVIFSIG